MSDKRVRITGGIVGIDGIGATSVIGQPDRTVEYPHPVPPFEPPAPDTAPFFVSSEVGNNGSGTPLIINTPAGYQDNDLMVLFVWSRNGDITTGVEDWTLVESVEKYWDISGFFGATHYLKAYYKYVSGSEPASYSINTLGGGGSHPDKIGSISLIRSASLYPEFVIENSSGSDNTSAYYGTGFESAQDQISPQNDNCMLVYGFGYSRSSNNAMLPSYVDDNAYWFGIGADNRNFVNRGYTVEQFLGHAAFAMPLTSSADQYGTVKVTLSVGHNSSGLSFVIRGTTTGSV